jgi:hypothetical protein
MHTMMYISEGGVPAVLYITIEVHYHGSVAYSSALILSIGVNLDFPLFQLRRDSWCIRMFECIYVWVCLGTILGRKELATPFSPCSQWASTGYFSFICLSGVHQMFKLPFSNVSGSLRMASLTREIL